MKVRQYFGFSAASLVSLLIFSACNGSAGEADAMSRVAVDGVTGNPEPSSSDEDPSTPNTPPASGSGPAIGSSCHSEDSSKLCLSLKYVSYVDSDGDAVVSEALALSNLAVFNRRWAQCGIAFEIGEFLQVDPTEHGLSFNTPTLSSLTNIRYEFEDDKTLLLVNTGNWSGSLGSGSANAYAEFPSGDPRGVVMEAEVADYPNIIAHELGHSLGLSHVTDTANVMSPVIYTSSTVMTSNQCTTARNSVSRYFAKMRR